MRDVFLTDMKNRLIELIIEKAFRYSEEPVFKLVSGRIAITISTARLSRYIRRASTS